MVILILTTLTLRFILHTSLLTSLPGLHWHSAFLRMRVNRFLRYLLALWLWQVPPPNSNGDSEEKEESY